MPPSPEAAHIHKHILPELPLIGQSELRGLQHLLQAPIRPIVLHPGSYSPPDGRHSREELALARSSPHRCSSVKICRDLQEWWIPPGCSPPGERSRRFRNEELRLAPSTPGLCPGRLELRLHEPIWGKDFLWLRAALWKILLLARWGLCRPSGSDSGNASIVSLGTCPWTPDLLPQDGRGFSILIHVGVCRYNPDRCWRLKLCLFYFGSNTFFYNNLLLL